MSYEFGITTNDTDLPDAQAWTAAAQSLGYNLVLEAPDWADQHGYLPVQFCGRPSGFELYAEREQKRGLLGRQKEAGTRITLRLGLFEHEAVCAQCALQGLSTLVSGSLWSEEGAIESTELKREAERGYREWRFLLAREHSDAEGLPGDAPSLWTSGGEDSQQRIDLIQELLGSRRIKPADRDGWYRLHKSVQDELSNDRRMRGS